MKRIKQWRRHSQYKSLGHDGSNPLSAPARPPEYQQDGWDAVLPEAHDRLPTRSESAVQRFDRFADSVLHPTDLSEASLSAFYHALAITTHGRATGLTLLHAHGRRSTDSFSGFPRVRKTIAKWRARGMSDGVEEESKRSWVTRLKVETHDPVSASIRHVSRHRTDLFVLAIEGRSGLARLLQPPQAERLARLSRCSTLFVPHGCRPFVSGATGEVWLRRILVPIDAETDPRPALLQAVRSAALLDDATLEITLLHIGGRDEDMVTDLPRLPFCKWNTVRRSGEPAEQILGLANEIVADAIFMSTSWNWPSLSSPKRWVTEAILRGANCPVATVPVNAVSA